MRAKQSSIGLAQSTLLFQLAAISVLLPTAGCAAPPLGPVPPLGPAGDLLSGILFAAGLLVVGGYLNQKLRLFSAKDESRQNSPGRDPAEQIARERYAKGELNREDFLRILSDLSGTPRTG
jgi:hypothetical protein